MMLGMEEILCELNREEMNEQGLPPGFRFYPTDEELITFYLASKVYNGTFCGIQIAEVDLNRCEPWELPEVAKMGEREWYFFSLRDRKYPTGLRTNRATGAGYWKATGKDREVYGATNGALIGMKKTLVFYKGRAPRGEKTKWVMHEYRLDGDFSFRYSSKEEWVICRIVHKVGEKKNATYEGASGDYPTLKTWSSSMNSSNPKTSTTLQNNHYLFHHHENDLVKSLFNTNNNNVFHFPMNNNVAHSQHISTCSSSSSSKKNETMLSNFYDQNAFGMNSDWSSLATCMEEGLQYNYFNNVVMDNNNNNNSAIKIAAQSWPRY